MFVCRRKEAIADLLETVETSEGLDKKVSLNYYSRMRFTTNLLPLLRAASSGQPPIARVISVLGAGQEASLNTADLSLRNPGSFSLRAAANHAITMTTLTFDHLASDTANKGITFIHSSPGGVDTNAARSMGPIMRKAISVSMFVLKPTGLIKGVKESGERHLWAGTNDKYASGLALVGPSSDSVPSKILEQLKKDGVGEKVWVHTKGVFDKISGEGAKYEG
jgi:NAD(P)-dependent dehydrogenase (short-subunit alcohol dehydrogenase family)